MSKRVGRLGSYRWEGVLPSISPTHKYYISVRPLLKTPSYVDEKHLVEKTQSVRTRVLTYFFNFKIFWQPEDTVNSVVWGILLTYPPTYTVTIGDSVNKSLIFSCYIRMPFEQDSMYAISPFLGRFILSMMNRFTTTALLVASEDADEFYLLCIFAVVKSFYSIREDS